MGPDLVAKVEDGKTGGVRRVQKIAVAGVHKAAVDASKISVVTRNRVQYVQVAKPRGKHLKTQFLAVKLLGPLPAFRVEFGFKRADDQT
tara:strand:- start:435 stop:701 length:267 start_codon:yes stop_codon:yes gene_type:complete